MVDSAKVTDTRGTSKTATILSGQTTSDAIDLGGCCMAGLDMPASFTGSTIYPVFSRTIDGTYKPVYNTSGSQVIFTVGTTRIVGFSPIDFKAFRFMKLVSGSSEGADRAIEVLLVSGI